MTIFESIRQLLSQGDTAEALRQLIAHLEQTGQQPVALRTVRVLESNYNTARQKEIKGIIDFGSAQQVYSKVTDALLGITEDLEAGRTPTWVAPARVNNRVYWLIGGGILLLLGLIAGILLRSEKTTPAVVAAPVAAECPEFDTTGVTVMLIPFQNLGEVNSRPEIAIQTLIRDLTQRNNVRNDVQIYTGTRFVTNLPDIDDAMKVGTTCAADMVIWGQYEKVNEGISLDVRYVFTHQPNLTSGAVANTFRNLSELRTDSSKFSSLEDAVFSLCTFMALHEGNTALAEKWLDKVKSPSERAKEIQSMLKKQ
jgi:Effector-associated domain 11